MGYAFRLHGRTALLMKILIGYDGPECAYTALDDLQFAGLPKTGEAVIMSTSAGMSRRRRVVWLREIIR